MGDEASRRERIDRYYQSEHAAQLAEWLVDAEDEADRLSTQLAARLADNVADWTAVRSIQLMNEAGRERDRYRLAYHSARRRAARESVMATEAVEHLTADRDRWRQRYERLAAELDASRKTTHAPRLECVGEDEDGPVYWLAKTS